MPLLCELLRLAIEKYNYIYISLLLIIVSNNGMVSIISGMQVNPLQTFCLDLKRLSIFFYDYKNNAGFLKDLPILFQPMRFIR